jgi:hypothetical protein
MESDCARALMDDQGTRTPAFYKALRSAGRSEEQVVKTRERIQRMAVYFDDTLTGRFHHGVCDALGALVMARREGVDLKPNADSCAKSKEELLGLRESFDWYRYEGRLTRNEIEGYLDKAEAMEWNQEVVEELWEEAWRMFRPEKRRLERFADSLLCLWSLGRDLEISERVKEIRCALRLTGG